MDQQSDWIHRFHLGERSVHGSGVFEVRRGESWLGRLVGLLLRFPRTAPSVPVRVTVIRGEDGHDPAQRQEHWIRQIGRQRLASVQIHDGDLVRERFGPIEMRMRWTGLDRRDERLGLSPDGAAICFGRRRVGLPRWFAPHASAVVWASADDAMLPPSFQLRVRIWTPSTGLLLSYAGQIEESTDG